MARSPEAPSTDIVLFPARRELDEQQTDPRKRVCVPPLRQMQSQVVLYSIRVGEHIYNPFAIHVVYYTFLTQNHLDALMACPLL